jgi:hypothetical protein
MQQTFNNSQQIQQSLGTQLQNVVNQGNAGQGFAQGQEANLLANSKEQGAQQNVQAEQALNQRNAGGEMGGAASSGATAAGSEALASGAAANTAAANRGIVNQNADLATGKVASGLQGLGGLAGQETGQANALAGTAVNADNSSFQNQTTAFAPSNFWSNLGGSVLTAGLGAVAGPLGAAAGQAIGGSLGLGGANPNVPTNNNPINPGGNGEYDPSAQGGGLSSLLSMG